MRQRSHPRQLPSPPVRSCSVRRALAAALPIVLALILLPPLAFASPPDLSWVAGFYDGADGDDIVSLIYETSAANQTAPSHFGPLPCLLDMYLDGIVRHVPDCHFTRGPRSPPVLRSPEFVSVFNALPPPTSFTEAPVTLPVSRQVLSVPVLRPEDECYVSANALPAMPFDNRASVSFSEECDARLDIPCPPVAPTYPQAGSSGGTCGKPLAPQPRDGREICSPKCLHTQASRRKDPHVRN